MGPRLATTQLAFLAVLAALVGASTAGVLAPVAGVVALGGLGVLVWSVPPKETTPPATSWSITPHRLGELDRRQRVALALLALLMVATGAQVVRNLSAQDAIVVGDEALIALEAHEVTTVVPLTGKVTSAVLYGNVDPPVMNPGPIQSWTLAPFVKVLGTSVGSWVYAFTLNVGCVLLAAWAGFRRGGPRLGLVVLCTCLLMFETTAPGGISSVLNTRIVLMPLFAGLVVAAMIALGDSVLLPVLVLVASFVIQTHVGYAPVAATALVVSVAIVAWHRLRPDPPPALGRHLAAALAVASVCWALPLFEQFFRSGNLGALLGADVPHAGVRQAARAVATIFNPERIFLHRGELSSSLYAPPPLWAGVLLTATAGALVKRYHRRLVAHRELLGLAVGVVAAAALTAALTPLSDTGGEHFYWVRAVAFFLVLVVILIVTTSSPSCTPRPAEQEPSAARRRSGTLAWSIAVVALLAPFWAPKDHSPVEEQAMGAVHGLLPAVLEAGNGPEPLAVAHHGYWPAIAVANGLVTELVNRSVPVIQVNDTASPEGRTTLVVTQGPGRIGTPVARWTPRAIDDRESLDDVPAAVVDFVRRGGPLRLVGPGPRNLGDVLDGTAAEVCVEDFVRDPAQLLDLDPEVVADLYFQQQVAAPRLPPGLDQALGEWALAWPTDLHLAPPTPPDEPQDDLILSASSCP